MNATSDSPSGPSRLLWVPRLLAAFILGQTLFFKFTGAPESIHIFETLGAEPAGRKARQQLRRGRAQRLNGRALRRRRWAGHLCENSMQNLKIQ